MDLFKISKKQKGGIVMSTGAIVTLVLCILGFVGIGIWALTFGRKYRWPEGKQRKRKISSGIEVVTINAPGATEDARNVVADSCAYAVQACFWAWNSYTINKKMDTAENEIDVVGVSFITDSEMDEYQEKTEHEHIAAYFHFTSRSIGSSAPTAVVRKSLALNVVDKGEPVIHEMIHGLLHRCSDVGADHDHRHESWVLVGRSARSEYQKIHGKA